MIAQLRFEAVEANLTFLIQQKLLIGSRIERSTLTSLDTVVAGRVVVADIERLRGGDRPPWTSAVRVGPNGR